MKKYIDEVVDEWITEQMNAGKTRENLDGTHFSYDGRIAEIKKKGRNGFHLDVYLEPYAVFLDEEKPTGEISDGFHTFDELYYHRMTLFAVICKDHKEKAWKSWKHDDGTMYEDYFIVGIETPEGDYTYHYHKDHWDLFDVSERELAPKWDGHEPKDITRLLSLSRS